MLAILHCRICCDAERKPVQSAGSAVAQEFHIGWQQTVLLCDIACSLTDIVEMLPFGWTCHTGCCGCVCKCGQICTFRTGHATQRLHRLHQGLDAMLLARQDKNVLPVLTPCRRRTNKYITVCRQPCQMQVEQSSGRRMQPHPPVPPSTA